MHGALLNSQSPPDGEAAEPTPPADITLLHNDEEVHAWLLSTESRPIKILITLHGSPPRADTPPPVGGTPHFGPDQFQMYDDEPEDSSDEDATTRKVAIPRADRVFLS